MFKVKYYLTFLIIVFLVAGTGFGQEPSESDLAKQAQNPIASLISVPIQNNTNFGIGPNDETQNVMNIQPVWPFSITDNVESDHPYDHAAYFSAGFLYRWSRP